MMMNYRMMFGLVGEMMRLNNDDEVWNPGSHGDTMVITINNIYCQVHQRQTVYIWFYGLFQALKGSIWMIWNIRKIMAHDKWWDYDWNWNHLNVVDTYNLILVYHGIITSSISWDCIISKEFIIQEIVWNVLSQNILDLIIMG